MSTEILVSPIVSRDDGFAFDTFSEAAGLTPGFTYRRIEQASYDRKITLQACPGRAALRSSPARRSASSAVAARHCSARR